MKRRVLSLSLVVALFAALVGMQCNIPGILGLATIGAAGGTVELVDGDGTVLARATIPPGGLSEDTRISIVPLLDEIPPEFADDPRTACLLGTVYEFLPEGLTFEELIEITLFISLAELGQVPPGDLRIITTPLGGGGAALTPAVFTFEEAGDTSATQAGGGFNVRGTISHFSPFVIVDGDCLDGFLE